MIDITDEEFSVEDAVARARRLEAGAVVFFLGTVRDDGILGMEVEAYRDVAVGELEKIRDEATEKFGLLSVEVIHRVGPLSVGQGIVLIVCTAAHRQAAFRGCEYILEGIKMRVPIWKKEIRADGGRWV